MILTAFPDLQEVQPISFFQSCYLPLFSYPDMSRCLLVSRRAVCFLFSCSTGASCSPPCLAGPSSWPALSSVTWVDGAPGESALPCIVALQGERDGDLYHSQPRGHFPTPELGCHWFSSVASPELQQPPGGLTQIRTSRLGFKAWNHISFPISAFPHSSPRNDAY